MKNFLDKIVAYQTKSVFGVKNFLDWKFATTKVRGVNYYLSKIEFDKLCLGDEVLIAHSPNEEYYELTKVFWKNNQIGTIMQEFAIQLTNKFSKGFKFYGVIQGLTENQFQNKTFLNVIIKFSIPVI